VGKVTAPQHIELDRVFGSEAAGETIEERAVSSKRIFVRSQAQLSVYNERAKGLQMTAAWALRQFGFETLLRAVEEGAVVISANLSEPARTLREQRENLDLTFKQVAKASGLTEDQIRKAEQPGSITPIRKLRALAQSLGLSDEKISIRPGAGSDRDLAYRLRVMQRAGQDTKLSPSLVSHLAEAAWITSQQLDLANYLGQPHGLSQLEKKAADYSYPTWRKGYDLAEKTREILGINPVEPIKSVRALVDRLGIPLIQAPMGVVLAGATVVNGDDRGIAVNTEGENTNVWIRRMTLSHELGHLLWDPQEKLKHLHVDRYDVIRDASVSGTDVIESRANAFAIALLAPPRAVKEIIEKGGGPLSQIRDLMERYGIGATAAKYHLSNVARQWGGVIDVSSINQSELPSPDDSWNANENWTVDFFPVPGIPVSRRGKFAGLVTLALQQGKISFDTAGSWLGVDPRAVLDRSKDIIDITMD
jgi:Zn-dependent peptidase ImmA (M78 family)